MPLTQVSGGGLADNSVNAAKIATGAVTVADIPDGEISHVKLAADAVDGDNIADDSINSEHYVDGSIDAAHIADEAVTEPKLATDAAGSTGQFLQKSGATTMTWATVNTQAFASGTVMLFRQTAAPTNWTKDTTNNNNSAIRVVTGSVSTGGSDDFTTTFGTSKTTASHTLTIAEIPAHTHTDPYYAAMGGPSGTSGARRSVSTQGNVDSGSTGGDGGHSHNLSNFDVKYVDVIIATRD